MDTKTHFHFIVPVWSEEYTKLFCDACLPMLMIPGNLGYIPLNEHDKFVIVTTWNDCQTIKASTAYEQLRKIIHVKFILIDGLIDLDDTYNSMSYCYAIAMRENDVLPNQTYFVFLTADSFWSENTFKRLLEVKAKGYKVAMALGIRVKSKPVLEFITNFLQKNTHPISLPTKDLINVAMKHLHPLTCAFDLLSTNGFLNNWPSNLYWIDYKENQIIAHCFHMHPLMVRAPNKTVPIGTTIDAEFIKNLKYSLKDFHIFQDSYFAIDLTSDKRSHDCENLKKPSPNKILEFSIRHTNDFHMHFFKHQINISSQKNIDPNLNKLISKTVEHILDFHKKNVYIFFEKQHYRMSKIVKALIPVKVKRAVLITKKIIKNKLRSIETN